jgi:tRNA/rRNA methyltransferase
MPATSPLEWRIILVRPRNPLNIGAAARAAANFGLRDFVVVQPYAPVWQETRAAVGAEEVIRSARAVDQLSEAIADANLVIGTTAGSRRNFDRDLVSLDLLPQWLESAWAGEHVRAALLFGSEKHGLTAEQLSCCHVVVRIPTGSDCPSMNLGQAVAVCAYELRRAGLIAVNSPAPRVHVSDRANMQAVEHVFGRLVTVLDDVGYLQPKQRAATLIKVRRLLLDAGLTNNEVKILGSVLAQIEWKLGQPSKAVVAASRTDAPEQNSSAEFPMKDLR